MRYLALATDYDGTIAVNGVVEEITIAALRRFVESGRKLVLVTGRLVEDLEQTFAHLDLFERVVAENGAVVYTPATKELRILDEPAPRAFVDALRSRGVAPISIGHVIVATQEPYQGITLDTIRVMGLELHVEFNKGAVMVLPAGTNKRTGLVSALDDMRLSSHGIVGVGDAENDHAFLSLCECAVSVENALPSLKERSDWVTPSAAGSGVVELIDRVLSDDLKSLSAKLVRRHVPLGETDDGTAVTIDPFETTILIAGPSGSGKSKLATTLLERLLDRDYQLCVVDPEGDHEPRALLAAVGSSEHPPTVDEVATLLDDPHRSIVATLLAMPMAERPAWFGSMTARVLDIRARTGRPHWLIVDEAHHVLPAMRDVSAVPLRPPVGGVILVTVIPESVAREALETVNVVICTKTDADETLRSFAQAIGEATPKVDGVRGEAIVWRVGEAHARAVTVGRPRYEHLRHKRKYARGDVGEDKSFFFRGPKGALNLRAQNLAIFAQMASGVDDESWLFHLRAGDYSRWFRESIKDDALASEICTIEQDRTLSAAESRTRVLRALDKRYTLPQ